MSKHGPPDVIGPNDDPYLPVDMWVDPTCPPITHHNLRDLALRLTPRTPSLSSSAAPPSLSPADPPFPARDQSHRHPPSSVLRSQPRRWCHRTINDALHTTRILPYSSPRATFTYPCAARLDMGSLQIFTQQPIWDRIPTSNAATASSVCMPHG